MDDEQEYSLAELIPNDSPINAKPLSPKEQLLTAIKEKIFDSKHEGEMAVRFDQNYYNIGGARYDLDIIADKKYNIESFKNWLGKRNISSEYLCENDYYSIRINGDSASLSFCKSIGLSGDKLFTKKSQPEFGSPKKQLLTAMSQKIFSNKIPVERIKRWDRVENEIPLSLDQFYSEDRCSFSVRIDDKWPGITFRDWLKANKIPHRYVAGDYSEGDTRGVDYFHVEHAEAADLFCNALGLSAKHIFGLGNDFPNKPSNIGSTKSSSCLIS